MNLNTLSKSLLNHWHIILVEVLLIILAFTALNNPSLDKNIFLIAVVAPLSGERAYIGKDVIKSLELFAERINKYGGINGKTLKIEAYDHQDSSEIARTVAQKITKKNKAVAIIGNFSDKTTQATETHFHQASIPVIAPISNIKTKTKWNFQISPTVNDSGIYLAHYIKQVLNKNTVTLIFSKNKKDQILVKSFKKTFLALGGIVKEKHLVNIQATDFKTAINTKPQFSLTESGLTYEPQKIIENPADQLLFFATASKKVAPLIARLRASNIHLPIMTIDNTLASQLAIYPEEKYYPGFFSEGIYTPSILLLDSINRPKLALVKKDYDLIYEKKMSRTAMTAVLAVSLISKNLKSLSPEIRHLKQIREHIKIGLQQDKWFNQQQIGLATNIFMGIFQRQNMISASINPTLISIGDLPNLKAERKKDKLFTINGKNLYKTNFVYAGVSMNKISDINPNDLSYNLDFFLWFRYKNAISHADDIEFLNTEKPERLYELLEATKKNNLDKNNEKKNSATLISSHSLKGETYHRYHVKARFKTTNIKNYALGQQNMYIKFRHNKANLFKLNYVSDFVNANGGIFNQENHKANIHLIDDQSLTLNYNVAYLGISYKNMQGSPQGFNKSNQFSEFIAEYRIKATPSSFRGFVSWVNTTLSGREDIIKISAILFLLSMSCGIFIVVIYVQQQKLFENIATFWWALEGLMIFFILLFGELALSDFLYHLKYHQWGINQGHLISQLMLYLQDIIAILWWLIPAYYITSAFEQFLWRPIERRTGTEVPHVLRLFVCIIVYLLAGLGVLSFVLEVTVTGLAATSGLIAIIFALASKIDLSNLISGLGISFAKTFYMGDWIKINDSEEGRVIEMSARSTKILTMNSSLIIMPNTTVAGAVIENYNRPDSSFRLVISVKIAPLYRFERIEKILLDAIFSIKDVLDEPEPYVIFKGQDISSQIYDIAFFIDDYAKRSLWQVAWRRIWRHLEQANISLITPQRKVFTPIIENDPISAPLTVIVNCGAFAFLSTEKREQLAKILQSRRYKKGEIILAQDEDEKNLFIITEGVVYFDHKETETEEIFEINRLGVAEVFGELSLLNQESIDGTAVAKTETEVFIITRDDFMRVLGTEQPNLQLTNFGKTIV